ncbi:MAG: threonine--tRNA ligase [Candidatus Omnitrophica bacterium]|nr:threonine--tRNA ligase [Candidatus Omnitrophota bacterium]MBU4488069.1 threonine--tRNA ligase [Candidatus Omnitrophota bacterium]MCG2704859.1 threonine--tRNA ligase [Candidatus Omnitrophota bacterium]
MNLETLRHSASHIMADAVKELYPDVKLGIGPAIEDGFYYDFDRKDAFRPEDLAKIEEKMREIISKNDKFTCEEMKKQDAVRLFEKTGEKYKVEIIKELEGDKITIYKHGKFTDLCKGPHVNSTGEVKSFKLLSIAGAYWRGNENNPMLQRIYGTAFSSDKELAEYLKFVEESKKRDHRKLGKELELFTIQDNIGAGLVLYYPKGAMLRSIIEDFIKKEHFKRGYEFVRSPHIMKSDIWVQSGHYEYYKENMYIFKIENQEYAIKPMNCPGHMLVYKSRVRSYRELPIKLFELGDVYRHEKSGVLHGLLRVRGFTQDDAHIFCLREQVEDEIIKVIDFVKDVMDIFGFKDMDIELSTRPPKYIGKVEDWERAQEALINSLKRKKLDFEICEGEGAFYGPKIDIKIKDALKRPWQCATIQCDFALPERFDLKYTGQDGKEERPIMLHRVILGSLERFIGTLIEHYAGEFPLWLAPVQMVLIPISDKQNEYAETLREKFSKEDFRVEIDKRDEKMQKKIRTAELEKVPYMLIVGGKEAKADSVSVRSKKSGDLGILRIEEFIKKVKDEINRKQ